MEIFSSEACESGVPNVQRKMHTYNKNFVRPIVGQSTYRAQYKQSIAKESARAHVPDRIPKLYMIEKENSQSNRFTS